MRMNKSRSSLFLMEFIICILFFAFASAVCVRIFVTGHQISASGKELNQAVIIAQNYAEQFRSEVSSAVGDGANGFVANNDGTFGLEDGEIRMVYYDEEFAETSQENAVYMCRLETSIDDGMCKLDISITDANQEQVYASNVKKHVPYVCGK